MKKQQGKGGEAGGVGGRVGIAVFFRKGKPHRPRRPAYTMIEGGGVVRGGLSGW